MCWRERSFNPGTYSAAGLSDLLNLLENGLNQFLSAPGASLVPSWIKAGVLKKRGNYK